jgi:hypothetical protein
MRTGPIRERTDTATRTSQAAASAAKEPTGSRLTERMKAMTSRNLSRASARWRALSPGM